MVIALIAASCAEPSPPTAPDTLVITEEPSCEGCTIALEEVAVLGHPADSASFRYDAPNLACVVGQLSDGSFVSSGLVGGQTLFRYDGSGRAIQAIGRGGEGPGELSVDLAVIVGARDSLFVVDRRRHRVLIFDPLGVHQRSFDIPWRFDAFTRLTNGNFVFQRRVSARQDGSQTGMVRVLDAMGNEIAAHDPPSDRLFELGMPDLDGRNVSPSVSGGYWTTAIWSYELSRWSSPGVRDLVLVRNADWFPPNPPTSADEVEAWHVDAPPPRRVLHVSEAPDGLVWTFSVVPDPRWRPRQTPDAWDVAWANRTTDTVIEVLDITNGGAVVARTTIDERPMPVCGDHLMSVVRETPEGDTRAVVVRPVLERPE